MYSTHNEGRSVFAERLIKTLKAAMYKRMIAIDSKSYLSYLNNYRCNNLYHYYIGEKPITADYSALTEKIETNLKAPEFKVNDRVRITKYMHIFSKGYTENWSREMFIIDFVLKTNPWTYKINNLSRKKVIGSFYKKELLLD